MIMNELLPKLAPAAADMLSMPPAEASIGPVALSASDVPAAKETMLALEARMLPPELSAIRLEPYTLATFPADTAAVPVEARMRLLAPDTLTKPAEAAKRLAAARPIVWLLVRLAEAEPERRSDGVTRLTEFAPKTLAKLPAASSMFLLADAAIVAELSETSAPADAIKLLAPPLTVTDPLPRMLTDPRATRPSADPPLTSSELPPATVPYVSATSASAGAERATLLAP
jgi:hypothetical protein